MYRYKIKQIPANGDILYELYVYTKKWYIFPYWKRVYSQYTEERCMEFARVYSTKHKEFVL